MKLPLVIPGEKPGEPVRSCCGRDAAGLWAWDGNYWCADCRRVYTPVPADDLKAHAPDACRCPRCTRGRADTARIPVPAGRDLEPLDFDR